MADSKSEALTNLIQSLASATGWANTSSNSTPHSNHSSPTASTSTPPNSWRNFPMWRASGILAIFLLCVAPALAQQEMRSSTKGTSIPLPITGTTIDSNHNALDTTLNTLIACERLQDQASNGHCVIVDAANLAVISKTSAVTIGGGVANDTYLKRVIVLAALTGTCVFTGFADSDGVAQSFTIPSAFVGERNFGGAKNSAGALTVTCSNASDDNLVLVEWWPAS